jgi:hypothetical protein
VGPGMSKFAVLVELAVEATEAEWARRAVSSLVRRLTCSICQFSMFESGEQGKGKCVDVQRPPAPSPSPNAVLQASSVSGAS